jgi:hypothetical protein
MTNKYLPAAAIASLAATPVAAQPPGSPPAPACDPADGYICGVEAPEDLMALGNDWAVASAMAGSGGVTLIRLADRMAYTAYPSPAARAVPDATTYPDCPGPPETGEVGAFTTHGVYVAPGAGPQHKLFVVGHGARESIEIFDVDTSGAIPDVTWIGCVIAPDPIGLNSVRGLPDGGFLTTNFNPRNMQMQAMMDGTRNGELWEWHTDSGWEMVPGSEASGANGVELSDDGQTIYVAAWGSQSFFTLSANKDRPDRQEIDLGFRIDNIHWSRDGRLITAGQVGQDWRVALIDPETLEVEEIYRLDDMPGFGGGTVALEVGDELWIGSYRGDRIAVIPND